MNAKEERTNASPLPATDYHAEIKEQEACPRPYPALGKVKGQLVALRSNKKQPLGPKHNYNSHNIAMTLINTMSANR
ncbi:hypothetical protein E2C01_037937 [Portunus trituberculatus]|uniref:Uncharacterized protein n=1 Tax=Portunus trituberculatus TaxID=210409 RepID=A0A5B7FH67_PORTR|nr:hypothetical protein [Portunus trituberculatus]